MALAAASVMPIQSGGRSALSWLKGAANLQSASQLPCLHIVRSNHITARSVSNSNLACGETKRGTVARGAGVSVETSIPQSSLEELKAKGDSYFAVDKRPVVLFDGVCNLCNGAVNFVLDNDPEGKLRMAALQSDAGRALLARSSRAPDDISSVVLVDKDRAYIKSEAVLQTLNYLGFPFPPVAMAASIVPLFIRDIAYDQVADNRYNIFGQSIACRFTDPRFEARFIAS